MPHKGLPQFCFCTILVQDVGKSCKSTQCEPEACWESSVVEQVWSLSSSVSHFLLPEPARWKQRAGDRPICPCRAIWTGGPEGKHPGQLGRVLTVLLTLRGRDSQGGGALVWQGSEAGPPMARALPEETHSCI